MFWKVNEPNLFSESTHKDVGNRKNYPKLWTLETFKLNRKVGKGKKMTCESKSKACLNIAKIEFEKGEQNDKIKRK